MTDSTASAQGQHDLAMGESRGGTGPTADEIARLELGRCGSTDRAEQVRLFQRCFTQRLDERDLAWRYDENPSGAALSLVYRPPGADAICNISFAPRRAIARGDESTLGTIALQGDVMTDPDWRRRGLVMRLSEVCAEETRQLGWIFNWGYPNRRSASVFRRLGWQSVGLVRPWDFYFDAGLEARRERLKQGRLRAWRLPWDVRRSARRRSGLPGTRALSVERLERFPAAVEGLSRSVEPRFDLMLRRDAQYLDWRFIDTPRRLHEVHGLFEGAELRGYVVLQRSSEQSWLGYVSDLLAIDDDVAHGALAVGLERLAASGVRIARAHAVDGSWWQQKLSAAGFLAPKPENHLHVYVSPTPNEHPLVAAARDASRWYLTDADRDEEYLR